jgi:hypothetical protein
MVSAVSNREGKAQYGNGLTNIADCGHTRCVAADHTKVWHQGDRFIVEVAKDIAIQVEADLRSHGIGHSIVEGRNPVVIFEVFSGQESVETVLRKYEHRDSAL